MAKVITITNGTGTSEIINGEYDVEASVVGYDNSSITPQTVDIEAGTNTYAFTISSNGTLTLHVTEDGTSSGVPIVGATFIRTDSNGTEYGTIITTDSNGDSVFNNMPFDATNPPPIYYVQKPSDGDHEFYNTIKNSTMTTSTSTLQIENLPGAVRTITLTDANYANLPIESGTITLS